MTPPYSPRRQRINRIFWAWWWLAVLVVFWAIGVLVPDDHEGWSDRQEGPECWEVDTAACPGYRD